MSAATHPSADAAAPDGDWVFPLHDAAVATRAALVAGASAFGLVLLVLLAFLGVLLPIVQPGVLVPGAPLALLPLVAGCIAAWRWAPLPVAGCVALAVAAAGSFVALATMAAASPAQAAGGTASFMLSMPTVVVVLLGAAADRWTGGIAGALIGYAIGEGTVALTGAFVGLPYRVDLPPIAITLGVVVAYSLFPLARTRARRGTASLERADRRSRARRLRELEGRESIAVLHDTLLGELAVLARREPGPLSEADRIRLTRSLESSAMLPLLREETPAAPDGMGVWLSAIGEAGGVRVRLEGDVAALDTLAEPEAAALRAALEQCVVNVARHAGVEEAWIAVAAGESELSVTVVDEGVGFDPDAVPADRLGLSESVRGRIERCGGSVRVWSSPGAGTSVHLVVPGGRAS